MGNLVTMRQRGFTLIEMSIVLVIIGLIVGGILKGQELIESARQKNVVSQIDQIKSGVTTFIDRYKGYPGDFSRATSVISSLLAGGNDDGIVGTQGTNTTSLLTTLDGTDGENVQFWDHLLAANAIGGGSVVAHGSVPTSFSGLSANPSPLPSAAFPQSGLAVVYSKHSGVTANTGSPKEGHWIIIHRFSNTALQGGTTDGVISPVRAFQLDNKYDDGVASEGNIRTLSVGTGCGDATTTYDITNTTTNCHLAFFLQ